MSPAALRAVFSPESDADLIFLLSIYDPVDPTNVTRLCDGVEEVLQPDSSYKSRRLSETDEEITYGVKSTRYTTINNITTSVTYDFMFLPMEITLPTENEAQAPRSSIILHDVTRYVTPLIREMSGPPKILMELVLSTTPSTVEASFSGFYISSVTYNATTVSLELNMIDYEREPFPQHSFSPKYFPGMF
jgi:hypothetical protein